MADEKKEAVVEEDVAEAPAKKTTKKTADSDAKKQFEAMIEAYKKQNPVKYELKKEALEAKLKTL